MANKGQFSGKKHPMFGRKHSLESIRKMSISQKKRFARDGGYWLGKKRSEETKRKVSQSQLGRIISVETIEKRRAKMIGHKTSPETRRKISEAQKGKSRPQTGGNKNGSWKGGLSSLVRVIRHCIQYDSWRMRVFDKDKFACTECGDDRGRNLVAHHIKSFSSIMEDFNIKSIDDALKCDILWDTKNGKTLCEKCHDAFHKINWKNQYGK